MTSTSLNIRRYEGLSALPDSYEHVFSAGQRHSLFLSLPWFRNFERTVVRPDEQVLIYGVEESSAERRPLATLPLRRTRGARGILAPATLEGLSNYYTSYFGPVLRDQPDDMGRIINALADALWADRQSWDVCNLQPLDRDSPIFPAMVSAFQRTGMVVQTYFCFGNWYLEVAGRSYREYVETLPSPVRETIRRKGKKLEKQSGVDIEILTDREIPASVIEDYTRIYLSSWKTPEPYPLFMPGLIRTCAEMGWLRLGMVYVDKEPAATQVWIVNDGIASIYKLAYDERFSRLSAGTVLTSRLMQHVIDVDKVSVVDYLTGDDGYKKDWMSHRRERWGIMAFNPRSPRGLAQAVRHVGGRAAKRLARKLVPQGWSQRS